MCQNLIFIKVADWRTATLSKKTLPYRYFSVNFANSFRKPPSKIMKVSRQLLLLLSLKNTNLLSFSFFLLTFRCLFIDLLVH